jgi:hypothetical protein
MLLESFVAESRAREKVHREKYKSKQSDLKEYNTSTSYATKS